MPQETRAGFPTYSRSFGKGPRNALMIHCSLAHSGAWEGLANKLLDRLVMTAFDVPGHGRSGTWDHSCGEIQALTTDIAASFLEGPADIIGHSFGGTVALRLAVEHPDLVRSLTLIEPVFFAVAWKDNPDLARHHDQALQGFEDAWVAGDMEGAAREFISVWGDGTPWEDIPTAQRAFLASRIHIVAAGGPAIYDDAAKLLSSGALERIKAPTTIIEGDRSPRYISAINKGLERRIAHSNRVKIQGAGHMVPITHPDYVAKAVLDLLDRS